MGKIKYIVGSIFLIFLLVGMVSALDFKLDNYKLFDSKDGLKGSAEIWDKGLIGSDTRLAKITLIDNTDYCITNCEANVRLDLDTRYSTPFDKLDFYDKDTMNSKELISSEVLLRTTSYLEDVTTSKTTCDGILKNGSANCYPEEVVTQVTKYNYEPYTGQTLEAGTHYFKIVGTKKIGESIEWIPTFLNFEIDEWAVWTAGLSVDLMLYYNFNATETNAIDFTMLNLTHNEGTPTTTATNALIGTSGALTTDNNWLVQSNASINLQTTSWAIQQWVRPSAWGAAGSYNRPMRKSGDYYFEYYSADGTTADLYFNVNGGSIASLTDTTNRAVGSWYHNVVVKNSTTYTLYVNGAYVAQQIVGVSPPNNNNNLLIGSGDGQSDFQGLTDEIAMWNRSLSEAEITDLYNAGAGITYDAGAANPLVFSINLTYPGDNLKTTESLLNFNATHGITYGNLTNTTLYVWYANSTVLDTNVTTFSGFETINATNTTVQSIPTGTGFLWNYYTCGVNNSDGGTGCTFADANRTFDTGYVNYGTHYENVTESSATFFQQNITVGTTSVLTNVTFVYNGTTYNASSTLITGANYSLNYSMNAVPLIVNGNQQQKYWYFSFNLDNVITNTTGINQSVDKMQLNYCNSSLTQNYINITVYDETDSTKITNTTVDSSTWYYWETTGDKSINRTLSYTNTTGSDEHSFCFIPAYDSIKTDLTFKYAKTGYPQRTYTVNNLALTNTSTQSSLYLLATADGIYSSIAVTNLFGGPISGVDVLIEREISGSYVTIGQATTDDSGLVTFWVNPDYLHRLTASKTGYTTTTVSIQPSQSLYTLTLSDTSSGNANYTSEVAGVMAIVRPPSGFISNGTTNFNLTLTASKSNLENCKFDLFNATNISQNLASTTGVTNVSYCYLSITYTTDKDQKIFGRISVDTTSTSGFVIINEDVAWVAIDLQKESWRGLQNFFSDFASLSEFGEEGAEGDFSRLVIFFIIATTLLVVFTYFTEVELNNPGITIFLIFGIILLASAGGFLTFERGSSDLDNFMEQWSFALLSTFFMIAYFINYFRRTST